MGYSTGLLRHRIEVLNRMDGVSGDYGLDGDGIGWKSEGLFWAGVDFVRGLRALREGSVDVYGIVMIRMRWNEVVDERSRIVYNGRTYQVLGETVQRDKRDNVCQFQAQIVVDG